MMLGFDVGAATLIVGVLSAIVLGLTGFAQIRVNSKVRTVETKVDDAHKAATGAASAASSAHSTAVEAKAAVEISTGIAAEVMNRALVLAAAQVQAEHDQCRREIKWLRDRQSRMYAVLAREHPELFSDDDEDAG